MNMVNRKGESGWIYSIFMDGYSGGISMWCHVVGTRDFVKLLACVNVAFRES